MFSVVKTNLDRLTGNQDHAESLMESIEEWDKRFPEWSYFCKNGENKGQWLFRHSMQTPYIDKGGHQLHAGDVCLHTCYNKLMLCYMLPSIKGNTSVRCIIKSWHGVQTSISLLSNFRKIPIEILSQEELDWVKEQEAEHGFRKQRNLTT